MATPTLYLSTEGFKTYCPQLHTHFPWEQLSRMCDLAAHTYLVDYIGEDYYQTLITAVQTSNLGDEGHVLEAIKVSLAHYTYADLIINQAIQVSEAGVMENTPDDGASRPATQYARHDARDQAMKTADQWLDYAIIRLEKSLDNDPTRHQTYRESEAYQQMRSILVDHSRHVWNQAMFLRSARAIYHLRHHFHRIQTRDIKSTLGETWYNDLTSRYADPAQDLTADETSLLPYLRSYLVKQTLYEAIPELRVEMDTGGLYLRTYDGPITNTRRDASDNNIRALMGKLKEEAEQARVTLIKYLNANAKTFTDYTAYEYESGDLATSHKPHIQRGKGMVWL